ncbi:MAG: hypothetical protein ABSA05_01570 [Opitutaceae bacterium]|jgi:hypothetical protein
MNSHDYLREIGMEPDEKTVPWPHALAFLAILAAMTGAIVAWELKSSAPLPGRPDQALTTHSPSNPATPSAGSVSVAPGPGGRVG